MGLLSFLKRKVFGEPVVAAPVKVEEESFPPEFTQDYDGECPETIVSEGMKVIYDWHLSHFCVFQPEQILFGEKGSTIIMRTRKPKAERWDSSFIIEKINLPVFIKLLEDSYAGEFNFDSMYSLASCHPDYLEVTYGSQKDGALLIVTNHRDAIVDGWRTAFDNLYSISLGINYNLPFIEILKKISAS